MFSDNSDPEFLEFPNWWDVLDEVSEDPRSDGADERDESVALSEGDDLAAHDEEVGIRVKESPVVKYSVNAVSEPSILRGYEREVIESVWNFADIVPGNDPDLWRKDEWGNWIHRFGYGRRESEFGWEIFDPGIGRHSQGVYAMRPMQWTRFLQQHEVFS